MEKIPSTMAIHKHVDGSDTRLTTMSVPLVNKNLVKCLGVFRRGTYQSATEDIWSSYEPVYDFWPGVDPDSDSSVNRSSDEGRKDQ